MKALTICQPYAELIARGEKLIENRTWRTMHRGPIVIHAGKGRHYLDTYPDLRASECDFGKLIAVAVLTNCVPRRKLPADLRDNEHAEGPFCWLLSPGVWRLPDPIPCPGALSLWTVPDDLKAQILEQYEVANPQPGRVVG